MLRPKCQFLIAGLVLTVALAAHAQTVTRITVVTTVKDVGIQRGSEKGSNPIVLIALVDAKNQMEDFDNTLFLSCATSEKECKPITKGKRYTAQIVIHENEETIFFLESPDDDINHLKVVAKYWVNKQWECAAQAASAD